jgi:prepilin-type N-terminal cleavage/methylation domain-containing protein
VTVRARGQGGYSLVEMLTVLSIMSVVLTGLVALFVQGSNAQLDTNRRFQAQQDARVALDKMRREIHCAQGATTSPATGAATRVTLDLPGVCPTAVGGAQTNVSWCTVSGGTNRYGLYRKVGVSCDATGVRWADYLIQSSIFQVQTASTVSLAKLRVNIPIDLKTTDATPVYALCDQIVLRNSSRTGTPGTPLPTC